MSLLKEKFPMIDQAVIQLILDSVEGEEAAALEQLEQLKADFELEQAIRADPADNPPSSPPPDSQNSTLDQDQAKAEELNNEQVLLSLVDMFPNIDAVVVKMVLEQNDFDQIASVSILSQMAVEPSTTGPENPEEQRGHKELEALEKKPRNQLTPLERRLLLQNKKAKAAELEVVYSEDIEFLLIMFLETFNKEKILNLFKAKDYILTEAVDALVDETIKIDERMSLQRFWMNEAEEGDSLTNDEKFFTLVEMFPDIDLDLIEKHVLSNLNLFDIIQEILSIGQPKILQFEKNNEDLPTTYKEKTEKKPSGPKEKLLYGNHHVIPAFQRPDSDAFQQTDFTLESSEDAQSMFPTMLTWGSKIKPTGSAVVAVQRPDNPKKEKVEAPVDLNTLANQMQLKTLQAKYPAFNLEVLKLIYMGNNGDIAATEREIEVVYLEKDLAKEKPKQKAVPKEKVPQTKPVVPGETYWDPSKPRPESSAERAPRILNQSNFNQYQNMTFEELIEESNYHAKLRNQYFIEASKAFVNGQGQAAKDMSFLGKKHGDLMQRARDQAARIKLNTIKGNARAGRISIDLHGFLVDDALKVLDKLVNYYKPQGKVLEVITGRGAHSMGGARIRPAVIEYFQDHRLRYSAAGEGAFVVHL